MDCRIDITVAPIRQYVVIALKIIQSSFTRTMALGFPGLECRSFTGGNWETTMHKTLTVALSALVLSSTFAFAGSATTATRPGIVIRDGHGASTSYTPPPATPASNLADAKRNYQDTLPAYAAAVDNIRKYEVNGLVPHKGDPGYAAYEQARKAAIPAIEAYKRADTALKKAQTPPTASQISSQQAHDVGAAMAGKKTNGNAQ